MKKICFLYSELASYTYTGLKLLAKEAKILVIHFPVNNEAPFKLEKISNCVFQKKTDYYNDYQKVSEFAPNLIITSGWLSSDYIKINKQLKKITKAIIIDNKWQGNLRQRFASILSPFNFFKYFEYALVPGIPQKKFAKKLGFLDQKIFLGFYSADADYFNEIYNQKQKTNSNNKILYLGRYVKHKGIFELWEAFKEIVIEHQNLKHWVLVCVGTGDQWENRIEHPNIKHLGFLQPQEMEPVLLDTSIYILPSHFEPWGVSVHEMAAAGFPLLLSEEVGSKEAFLEEGKNGFSFPAKNILALKACLLKMMQLPESELQEMGKHSNKLAQKITPQKWVETIHKILED